MATATRESKTLRRLIGVGAIAAMLALFMAAPAGAQQIDGTDSGAACRFTGFTPSSVDPATRPIQLQIDGEAPTGSTVTVYVEGNPQGSQLVTGTTFSFVVTLQEHTDLVTANYVTSEGNGYVTGCEGTIIDPTNVTRTQTGGVTAVRGALAFTGSSNTTTHVLIAVAAVVLGGLLVVGAGRRRVHVDQ